MKMNGHFNFGHFKTASFSVTGHNNLKKCFSLLIKANISINAIKVKLLESQRCCTFARKLLERSSHFENHYNRSIFNPCLRSAVAFQIVFLSVICG